LLTFVNERLVKKPPSRSQGQILSVEMRSHFRHMETVLNHHQSVLETASREISKEKVQMDYLFKKITEHDLAIYHIKNHLQL